MRNPHNPSTGNSLALLSVNKAVDDALLKKIATEVNATMAHSVTLP